MKFFYKILLVSVIVPIHTIIAQDAYKGKVIDIENGTALTNVSITNSTDNQIYISNAQGEFDVPRSGNYVFKKLGYHPTEIDISKSYQIIQLSINPSELNEVVINANQLPKRLKTATGTVNVISTADIDRANTTNIAPTLNRVPGVLM